VCCLHFQESKQEGFKPVLKSTRQSSDNNCTCCYKYQCDAHVLCAQKQPAYIFSCCFLHNCTHATMCLSSLTILASANQLTYCSTEGTVITAVCLCFANSHLGEQESQPSRPQTQTRCAVQKLTLVGTSSLSTSVSAGHVRKLSVPSLGSQACRATWPAAGINAIMAFACIAAQLTAASQGSSAARSRQHSSQQAGRQAQAAAQLTTA